jgi:hypothetical protein
MQAWSLVLSLRDAKIRNIASCVNFSGFEQNVGPIEDGWTWEDPSLARSPKDSMGSSNKGMRGGDCLSTRRIPVVSFILVVMFYIS